MMDPSIVSWYPVARMLLRHHGKVAQTVAINSLSTELFWGNMKNIEVYLDTEKAGRRHPSFWKEKGTSELSLNSLTSALERVNTLRSRENGRRYPDDIFKCIFLNENICIPINISLKFVPKGQINNIPSLVQIMAWRRPGDKPLFEPMMVNLVTHICVTQPQWVKLLFCLIMSRRILYWAIWEMSSTFWKLK